LLAHVERHVPPAISRRVTAFIGEIADVPFPGADLPQLQAARQDPRLMSDQTLGAWLDFIEAECKAHPVLIVLEDLHWGDFPSIQLVDAALRMLRESPLMVVGFGRPEVDEKFPGLWLDRDLQRVALAPMTRRSAQQVIQHVLGDVAPEKTTWIVDRADGNPFYLEELLRAVAETGGPDAARVLPDTVIGTVQARFDALGPEAKRVLRAAAIFGRSFCAAGVSALIEDEDRSIHRSLDVLVDREILSTRPATETRELVFRHALLEDAAYAMLGPADLVEGHRLAGEFLEGEGEREAMVLVNHFEKGGQTGKAAHWCRLAAEQALEANDLAAVIERVGRGVRLGAEGAELGAIRVAEAQARFWRGEYQAAETAASEAAALLTGPGRLGAIRELIGALGQQAKFTEVLHWTDALRDGPPDSSAWLECLVRAAAYLLPGGFYEATRNLLATIEANSQWLEPTAAARLDGIHGMEAWHEGSVARALVFYESAVSKYESLSDTRSAIEMRGNLAAVLADHGLLEEAEERLTLALNAADRMRQHFLSAFILMNLSLLRAQLGHFAGARSASDRAIELARKQGDVRIEGFSYVYRSLTACLEGQPREAEEHARSATRILREVQPVLPGALAALAQALLQQGKTDEALAPAEEAYRRLQDLGRVDDNESLIRLTYVECLLAAGRTDEGRRVLGSAHQRLIERAGAIQDPEWRTAFLSRLPVHARTMAMAKQLLDG
jgi:eukaryotic-like serine/threonine-protein kinase